jgi:hypothetical protein
LSPPGGSGKLAGMSEPLATASFLFTLDDMVDVTWRQLAHSPAMRSQHRRQILGAGVFCGLLAMGLLNLLFETMTTSQLWVGAVFGAALGMVSLHAGRHSTFVRAVRPLLRETLGPPPHRCTVELHADRAEVHQGDMQLQLAWREVDVVREDRGDIEIRSVRCLVVVRGRSFAAEGERARFLATALRLQREARPT